MFVFWRAPFVIFLGLMSIIAQAVDGKLIGTAGLNQIQGSGQNLQALTKLADSALYKAKNNGRNRTEFDQKA